MGYEIRTLATLATQARQFFTQSIPGALVRIWANTFTVLGKVLALLDFEHELRRRWLFKQVFASTADQLWLTRHGFELGLAPDPGNFAVGSITVAVTAGDVVPLGTSWARGDGVTYSTLVAVVATGTSADLPLQCDQVGAIGDMAAGDTLTVVLTDNVPISLDLNPTGTVDAAGLTGGTDAEDVETFRARVLYRKRNPPQGGSAPDYEEWVGKALSTAKSVYVDSFQNDSRSVWVCFTVTDQPSGVPTSGQVAIVEAYVSDPVRRPVTARVFSTGPTAIAAPIAVTHFYPDTDDTRGAVLAELAALQADEIQPATPSAPFVLYREAIDAAIKRAAGVVHFTLVTPATDTTYSTPGQMPVLGVPAYS